METCSHICIILSIYLYHIRYYKMGIAQLYFIQITGQYDRASRVPPQRERHRARPGSNRQPFTRQLSVVAQDTTTAPPFLNAGNRCKLSIYRTFIHSARTLRWPHHHGGVLTRRAAMMRARTRRHTARAHARTQRHTARTHARTLGKTHARTHARTHEHTHKHTTRRPRTHTLRHTHTTHVQARARAHTQRHGYTHGYPGARERAHTHTHTQD
jgi:hypothetical protein